MTQTSDNATQPTCQYVHRASGAVMIATLENVRGRAWVEHVDPETGELTHSGTTDMFWDEQRTVLSAKGSRIWLDEEGEEYPEDELELAWIDPRTGQITSYLKTDRVASEAQDSPERATRPERGQIEAWNCDGRITSAAVEQAILELAGDDRDLADRIWADPAPHEAIIVQRRAAALAGDGASLFWGCAPVDADA